MQGTLRVTVAVQCWGAAGLRLLHPGWSPLAQMKTVAAEAEIGHYAALDYGTAAFLVAAGLLSLTRPMWPVLLPVVGLFAADAVAPIGADDNWLLYPAAAARAASIVAPLALALLDWFPPKARFSLARFLIAIAGIRYATAATFAAWGLIAIAESRHPGTLSSALTAIPSEFGQTSLSPDAAGWAMALVGAIHWAFAMNVVSTRSRMVVAMLAGWALLCAALPIYAVGARGLLDAAVRAAEVGAPLVLVLYWTRAIEERGDVLRAAA